MGIDHDVRKVLTVVPWLIVLTFLVSCEERIAEPFHPAPDDAELVHGSRVDCTGPPTFPPVVDAPPVFSCELDTSDPRVSGTEVISGKLVTNGSSGWAWDGRAIITTEQGVWRGNAHVWLIRCREEGLCASSSGIGNVIIGWYIYAEAHFVGEGAYEGLEFHYYSREANGIMPELRGWIAETA